MARIRGDFKSGSLSAQLLDTATTYYSAELATFPVVTAPDYAVITLDPNSEHGAPEIVYITAHANGATSATITRAQELAFGGGAARVHPLNTKWLNGITAGEIASFIDASSSNNFTATQTFSAGSTTTVGIIAKAIASQTSNLQEWQDSAGVVLSRIAANGNIYGNAVFDGGNRVYSASNPTPDNAAYVHIANTETITGAKTFSAAVTHSSTTQFGSTSTGTINIGDGQISKTSGSGFTFSGSLVASGIVSTGSSTFVANVAATVPLIAKGFASQSGDLQQWQNSAATVLSRVDSAGLIYEGANRVYSAGNANLASSVVAETSYAQASGVGVGTLYARNDHTHGTPATPVTSAVAGTGITVSGATGAVTITNAGVTSIVAGTNVTISGGTGAVTVNAPAFGATVTAETTWGIASAIGVAATLARADHTHGTPATPVTTLAVGAGLSTTGATGAITLTNTGALSVAGRTGAITLTAADIAAGTFPGTNVFTGGQTFRSTVAVQSATASTGYLQLQPSDTTHSGYIEFWSFGGIRQGYIGLSTTNAATDTGTIPYVATTHAFSGAITSTGTITENGNRVYSAASGMATAVVSGTAWGIAPAVGTGILYARDNHTHGTPPTPVTAITTGSGLTTMTNATGSITLANTGVTSALAGTGIGVSGATGAVTISNTGVTSAAAGSNITVSGGTGAVTVGVSTAPTFTGIVTASAFSNTGLTGAVTPTRFVGGTASAAPTTGTFLTGDYVIAVSGGLYICTAGGTPGTWTAVSGIAPGNMVTTDTTQTISGTKTFSALLTATAGLSVTGSISASTTITASTTVTGTTGVYDGSNRVYSSGNAPPYPVTSVFGRTGAISASATDIGAGTFTGAFTFASTVIAPSITAPSGQPLNLIVAGRNAISSNTAGTEILANIPSQTADSLQITDSALSLLTRFDNLGRLGVGFGSGTLPASANIMSLAPASQAAIIKGAASQTANLMEFQDSTGAILARVANDGTIYKGAQVVGGNAADTEILGYMGVF